MTLSFRMVNKRAGMVGIFQIARSFTEIPSKAPPQDRSYLRLYSYEIKPGALLLGSRREEKSAAIV